MDLHSNTLVASSIFSICISLSAATYCIFKCFRTKQDFFFISMAAVCFCAALWRALGLFGKVYVTEEVRITTTFLSVLFYMLGIFIHLSVFCRLINTFRLFYPKAIRIANLSYVLNLSLMLVVLTLETAVSFEVNWSPMVEAAVGPMNIALHLSVFVTVCTFNVFLGQAILSRAKHIPVCQGKPPNVTKVYSSFAFAAVIDLIGLVVYSLSCVSSPTATGEQKPVLRALAWVFLPIHFVSQLSYQYVLLRLMEKLDLTQQRQSSSKLSLVIP
jgi:hypothetical protein